MSIAHDSALLCVFCSRDLGLAGRGVAVTTDLVPINLTAVARYFSVARRRGGVDHVPVAANDAQQLGEKHADAMASARRGRRYGPAPHLQRVSRAPRVVDADPVRDDSRRQHVRRLNRAFGLHVGDLPERGTPLRRPHCSVGGRLFRRWDETVREVAVRSAPAVLTRSRFAGAGKIPCARILLALEGCRWAWPSSEGTPQPTPGDVKTTHSPGARPRRRFPRAIVASHPPSRALSLSPAWMNSLKRSTGAADVPMNRLMNVFARADLGSRPPVRAIDEPAPAIFAGTPLEVADFLAARMPEQPAAASLLAAELTHMAGHGLPSDALCMVLGQRNKVTIRP